jgi:UDP-2,3-diacylglucosamine pyrophosphatase LpxH
MIRRCKAVILLVLLLPCAPALAQQILQRVILIGDAGKLKNGKQPVTEALLASQQINNNTSIIFLGDNIYPLGLPAEGTNGYEQSKNILEAQLQLARKSPAQVYFIPGNHDWAKGKQNGWANANNQQLYIDSAQLPNAHFLPANGCPGPTETELAPGVILVTINSQWWLQQENKPGIESDCDCKSGDEVKAKLKEIAFRHRNNILIFASHHPFQTYGPHGGYFTIKQHLFPLTDLNKNAWLPLPLIGSIYPISRGVFGNIQDTKHPIYKKMIQQVSEALAAHPATVFVHGHDHNLQHIQHNGKNYIVSGSGIKTNRVKKGKHSLFAAAQNGYVAMDIMSNRSVLFNFYSAENKLLYTYTQTLPPPTAINETAASQYTGKDSVTAGASALYDKAGGVKRFLFGQSYRKVWAAPVSFRVFHITNEKGGLKILQRGGGKQTQSLRLEDGSGKQWVIRSINKNPVSALPPALRETAALDIVQDQISAAHPYAPLVVPVLAEAAGVPHSNPELVWIPADTAFGAYQSDFANTLCLFEEREPGISGKSYSTAKVLENIKEDNDDRINQQAVLKARLFDMFIGDFDRHEDQWRWGAVKTEKGKTYYPVPRDRDQAFFINNGFITSLAAAPHIIPSVQGFRKKYRNINGFNFSTRFFDRNFLNEPDEDQWREAATALVLAMTDAVIDSAVNRLPPNINALSGEALRKTLKEKRNYFVNDALIYYRFLAKTIEVTGSDKKERFVIHPQRSNPRFLILDVYKITKDNDMKPLYRRLVDTKLTRELRLYGMGGADEFIIDAAVHTSLKLRMIGGKGKDSYEINGNAQPKVYDWLGEANDFTKAGRAQLRTSNNPAVNEYNRTAFQYNKNIPQFVAGFNPDDGISLGAGIKLVRHGFRKSPAAVYELSGKHSLSTRAFHFKAAATFNQFIGKTALHLFADIRSPNNTTNFFGYGNNSVFVNPGKTTFRFHRARYNLSELGIMLQSRAGSSMALQYGAGYQFYSMDADDNANRYILQTGSNGLANENIFQKKNYLTSRIAFTIDNRKNKQLPARGIYWTTGLQASKGLNDFSKNILTLQSDLRFYASLNDPARVVLAARLGGGHLWGDYSFFQAMMLGNHDNLRGFRNHRFSGRSMVYSNAELRIKLFDFSGYLFPGTVGLIGFYDAGRVWAGSNESNTWHSTPGAGLYVAPAGLVVIAATIGFSKEETLPFVSMGFRF